MKQLKKIGGATHQVATKAAMKTYMSKDLMAQFNKDGGGPLGKRALRGTGEEKTLVYQVLTGKYPV